MDAWDAEAGPRRVLYVRETDFRADDVDLSSPGALATVHRALVEDETRNSQIVADVAAALRRGATASYSPDASRTWNSLPPCWPSAGTGCL